MTEVVLERAQAGDERAFAELTEPYRGELRLHCYRLLGSLTDAEDALQETLLAAWRGLGEFAGRSSLRTWLYRIATNRCLNARRRVPPEPVPPFEPPPPSRRGEITWLQPYPDSLLDPESRYTTRETVELAFIAAVQRLPPRQAAALVLVDVLGFALAEVAPMLDTGSTAVKGLLQRARAALDRPPREPSAEDESVAKRFAEAFCADDIDAIITLLTDDAWLAMPPAPHEYHGAAAIAEFLRVSAAWRGARRLDLVPCRANTQPAFGVYHDGAPTGVLVLTLTGGRIRAITRFLDHDLPRRFGLSQSGEDTLPRM